MKKLSLVVLFVIGWYLFMAVLHYFNQRPLWNDEACVYANITNGSLDRMFHQGLSHDQEFPRVYLYGIGLFSSVFNGHLLALRFFPFVMMVMAFLIWIFLVKRQMSSMVGVLTFVLCWTASAPLIYYAAELKQYSMDVLVGAIFLLFLYHQKSIQERWSRWMYGMMLVVLSMLGVLSYAAFFFMPLPLYNLWMDARRESCWRPLMIVYLLFCIVCLSMVYYYDFRLSNAHLMIVYWKNYIISFDSPREFFRSLQEGINNLICHWFVDKPKWIRMVARFFIGMGLLRLLFMAFPTFKKDGFRFTSIGSVAGCVLLECFVLSAFKKIPFGVPRIYLFFAPMLLFCTVEAILWIKKLNRMFYGVLQYSFLIFLIFIALGIAGVILKGDLGAEPIIW
ncbi:MAG: glycosyltransferase family 39 protein [Candidatus Omnitrophica bacterium]|nr:glycosyltransferase family 39 protein [Candidatus Omnitrophota bacterium]